MAAIVDELPDVHVGEFDITSVVRETVREVSDDDVPGRAAEVAYHSILALFPFLLLLAGLTAVINRFVALGNLTDRIVDRASDILPEDATSLFRSFLGQTVKSRGEGALVIGLFGAALGDFGGDRLHDEGQFDDVTQLKYAVRRGNTIARLDPHNAEARPCHFSKEQLDGSRDTCTARRPLRGSHHQPSFHTAEALPLSRPRTDDLRPRAEEERREPELTQTPWAACLDELILTSARNAHAASGDGPHRSARAAHSQSQRA